MQVRRKRIIPKALDAFDTLWITVTLVRSELLGKGANIRREYTSVSPVGIWIPVTEIGLQRVMERKSECLAQTRWILLRVKRTPFCLWRAIGASVWGWALMGVQVLT